MDALTPPCATAFGEWPSGKAVGATEGYAPLVRGWALDSVFGGSIPSPSARNSVAYSKEKHREYELKRYHRLRKEAVFRLGGQCVKCGSEVDLDFDHVVDKAFNIAKLIQGKPEKLAAELEKCQLLCATHHREKHKSRAPCGTDAKYNAGCRCADCKLAHAEYQRSYRRKIALR